MQHHGWWSICGSRVQSKVVRWKYKSSRYMSVLQWETRPNTNPAGTCQFCSRRLWLGLCPHRYTLYIPLVRTKTFGQRRFPYCAPKQWNSLPSEVCRIQSSHAFKTMLRALLQIIPQVCVLFFCFCFFKFCFLTFFFCFYSYVFMRFCCCCCCCWSCKAGVLTLDSEIWCNRNYHYYYYLCLLEMHLGGTWVIQQ